MFMVVWVRSALDELATLWMDANSALRDAITVASDQIDQQLRKKPNEVGESRPDRKRIHFVQPLGFTFEIRQGVVRILHVWDARRKR